MDWIHCNTCSLQPGDQKERSFALTSCGHIYCDLCVVGSTKEKCRVCGSQCNTVQLTAQMRPDVQHFFTEPEDVLKKALKIMEFQKGHRQRLTSYRRSMVTRELAAIEEIKKLRNRVHELESEANHLRQTVAMYGKRRPTDPQLKSPPWPATSTAQATPTSHFRASQQPITSPLQQKSQQQQLSQQHVASPARSQQNIVSPATSQQHRVSPARSDSWVTPNRLTLRKSPSQASQSAVSPSQPVLGKAATAAWSTSPALPRSGAQGVSPLSKRPPSRISPYIPNRSSSSQGTMTLSPKDRFPYLSSQAMRK